MTEKGLYDELTKDGLLSNYERQELKEAMWLSGIITKAYTKAMPAN